MTTSVDVLAALRQIADGEGDAQVLAMRVHSAVAELIEACHYLKRDATNEQWSAFHAALARVKGA